MNNKRKWILVFFAAAMTLLVALASSAAVRADDFQCTGSLGAIQVGNLVVPQNASCTLNGTIVNGNLYVYTNATLDAHDVWVNNDIQADGAAHVNVYAGSSVGGNLEVVHSGAADIQAVDIHNNLYFNENHQFLNVSSNTIGGNLQASKNTGGVTINGNHIGGNLQCRENVPPPSGAAISSQAIWRISVRTLAGFLHHPQQTHPRLLPKLQGSTWKLQPCNGLRLSSQRNVWMFVKGNKSF